jgi:hypothetical protein
MVTKIKPSKGTRIIPPSSSRGARAAATRKRNKAESTKAAKIASRLAKDFRLGLPELNVQDITPVIEEVVRNMLQGEGIQGHLPDASLKELIREVLREEGDELLGRTVTSGPAVPVIPIDNIMGHVGASKAPSVPDLADLDFLLSRIQADTNQVLAIKQMIALHEVTLRT